VFGRRCKLLSGTPGPGQSPATRRFVVHFERLEQRFLLIAIYIVNTLNNTPFAIFWLSASGAHQVSYKHKKPLPDCQWLTTGWLVSIASGQLVNWSRTDVIGVAQDWWG